MKRKTLFLVVAFLEFGFSLYLSKSAFAVCEDPDTVSFPNQAPWGLTELYARRARGEAQARPASIDNRNGTYAPQSAGGQFFDTAQPEGVIFKDTKCMNSSDYSAAAGGREYVRLTNAVGQHYLTADHYGKSVSYGTEQSTFSHDGKWMSVTTGGRCLQNVFWCGSGGNSQTFFSKTDGPFVRRIWQANTNVVPPVGYNFGWGRGARVHKLFWTTNYPASSLPDLYVTDFETGASSVLATGLFTNSSHGSHQPKMVRSPEAQNGNILVSDTVEKGVGTLSGWQLMPMTVTQVLDGPEGPQTRLIFSGNHGLEARDRLRMRGAPDYTCAGDSTCDDIGERRVVKTVVDAVTVDIADGQFADYTNYSSDLKTPVNVTGFTLLYERYRQKVFVYNVADNSMHAEYFTDIAGLRDTSGLGPLHQEGEQFRMHSFGLSPTGEYWGGSFGAWTTTGESIPWKFPVTGTNPSPSDLQMLGKSPCTPGSWPYFGHAGHGPIVNQVIAQYGSVCGSYSSSMSIWDMSTVTRVRDLVIPSTLRGTLHINWKSNNKWAYVSGMANGEGQTNRMLMRCDTDAGSCETIARGYVGDTLSTDDGSIRPKTSDDGTKVLLNTGEFIGRGTGPLGTDYKSIIDIFYAVSFMPQAPANLSVNTNGQLSWPTPTIPLNGTNVPIAEAKGYHVYESNNVTPGACSGPWMRLTSSANASLSYDVSGRVASGQSKCYATTTEENSGLESDKLGHRVIVTNNAGSFSSADGGAAGVAGFDTTAPATPGIAIDSFQSIYGVSNNYVNGLKFVPSSDDDVRYYNIYYSSTGDPVCDKSTLIWSIPVSAINAFAVSDGQRPFFDYLADPNATAAYYGIKAVDRAGNESAPAFASMGGGPDTTPPTLSNVASSSITTSSANISWMTNENSDSVVDYGLTSAYEVGSVVNSNMVMSHLVSLNGLSASTLYHYRVKSQDASGNLATSGDFTFTTLASPAAPPTITSQPADQTVTEGQTATFSVTATGTAPLSYQWKKNGVDITGANASSYTTPATTLSDNGALFGCVVSNAAGSVTSNNATLTVNSLADTTPPVISSITVTNVGPRAATVNWITNEPADSKVNYGITTSYGKVKTDTLFVTSHSLRLTGLKPNKTYHFKITSKDPANNSSSSLDMTFTTV